MELRHLRYFVAVAEELHFSRAARRLRIAQPPLSRQIRALEAELGVELLERRPRGLRLTAGGEAFLEGARRVLAEAERAADQARRVTRGEVGRLVVAHVESPLHGTRIGALIRTFETRHPGVEVELRAGDSVSCWAALRAGAADVAITWWQPWYAPDLEGRALAEDPFLGVLLSARHPLADRPALPLRDLAPYPFHTLPRATNPPMYDHLLSALAERGAPVRPARTTPASWVMTGLVAESDGWMLATRSAEQVPAPGTVFRRFADAPIPFALAVVWMPGARNPCVQRFVDAAAALEPGGA